MKDAGEKRHHAASPMTMMVYTKGVAVEGGGGRRVSMELLHNFNRLGAYAFSWSVLPLIPETLYGGRYRYDSVYVRKDWDCDPVELDRELRQEVVAAFRAVLREQRPTGILFDTEYSFREFMFLVGQAVDPAELPPLGVLVHDQMWKWHPERLSVAADTEEARRLEAASPYPALVAYVEELVAQTATRYGIPELLQDRHHPVPTGEEGGRRLPALLYGLASCLAQPLLQVARALRSGKRERRFDEVGLEEIKADLRRTTLLFCLTPRSARETAAAYLMPPERVIAAHGFYAPEDLETSSPVSFRERCGTGAKKVLLAFSRLTREKNLEVILLSFARSHARNPQTQLWIAGLVLEQDAAYQSALEKLAAATGIGAATFFLGTVSDAEMNAVYAEADAFICAQVADFNLSVCYAMRFDKPVIVSKGYDFAPEVAASPAVLCNNVTVEDFSRSIDTAFTTGPCYDERAREVIAAQTFENYAQTVLQAFAECR